MKFNFWPFLLSLLFLLPNFSNIAQSQGTWQKMNNGLPVDWYSWLMDASSIDHAVVDLVNLSERRLYRTTDGGNSWNNIERPPGIFWDISVIDDSHFWFAGDSGIYATTNAGISWYTQFYDTSLTTFMNFIKMFDKYNGVAMGDAVPGKPALFLTTTDGGNNWIPLLDTTLTDMYSGATNYRLDFADMMNGFFMESGIVPQKMYKTTDGANTWSLTAYPNLALLVRCFDENIIFTAANNNRITKSTDGGNTWIQKSFSMAGYPNDFEFIPGDASKIFFTDHFNLYYSNDSGKVWSEVFVDSARECQGVTSSSVRGRNLKFFDENNGWFLTDCAMYKTTTGGVSSVTTESNIPGEYTLFQNYPNPFNPATTIEFQISEPGLVTIKVYDILGREIKTLINEDKFPGKYKTEFSGSNLPSGIYFYEIRSKDFLSRKKMTMVK
jgi:photosystem II stability/assembly factor-like uncharacterized protein